MKCTNCDRIVDPICPGCGHQGYMIPEPKDIEQIRSSKLHLRMKKLENELHTLRSELQRHEAYDIGSKVTV